MREKTAEQRPAPRRDCRRSPERGRFLWSGSLRSTSCRVWRWLRSGRPASCRWCRGRWRRACRGVRARRCGWRRLPLRTGCRIGRAEYVLLAPGRRCSSRSIGGPGSGHSRMSRDSRSCAGCGLCPEVPRWCRRAGWGSVRRALRRATPGRGRWVRVRCRSAPDPRRRERGRRRTPGRWLRSYRGWRGLAVGLGVVPSPVPCLRIKLLFRRDSNCDSMPMMERARSASIVQAAPAHRIVGNATGWN